MHPGRVVPQIVRVGVLISACRQSVRLRFELHTVCRAIGRGGVRAQQKGDIGAKKGRLKTNEAATKVRAGAAGSSANASLSTCTNI